jgi:hypothetical protein
MSEISRRALFGLSVGAVAATAVKPQAVAAMPGDWEIAMDFGRTPTATIFRKCRPGCCHTLKWYAENLRCDSDFSHVERCG